jgi:hypothetical protein
MLPEMRKARWRGVDGRAVEIGPETAAVAPPNERAANEAGAPTPGLDPGARGAVEHDAQQMVPEATVGEELKSASRRPFRGSSARTDRGSPR